MHCNGHCYLSKQKEKEQGNDKQPNETNRTKVEFSAYELPEEITIEFKSAELKVRYNESANIYLYNYASSIFHPPLG